MLVPTIFGGIQTVFSFTREEIIPYLDER